jgi:hypothetical protein
MVGVVPEVVGAWIFDVTVEVTDIHAVRARANERLGYEMVDILSLHYATLA